MSQNSPSPTQTQTDVPRDAAYWAKRRLTIEINDLPPDLRGVNVKGRHVNGPLQGFGQMWLKTYRITLKGAAIKPAKAIQAWKENFGKFWPAGNLFHAPLTGIMPGEVGILDLPTPGGMRLSTGVMVLFADEESFAFMTPEGHMFAAFITFSAYEEAGTTILQIQPLLRANDPLWEVVMRLYGFRKEDQFWLTTLRKLAAHFGVYDQEPALKATLIDPQRQWGQAQNIWHNAAVRSSLYSILSFPQRLRGKTSRPSTTKRQTITATMVTTPRDAPYWAEPTDKLTVSSIPDGAINLNVEGRVVISPLQGFGQLWQKTYRVQLKGVNSNTAEVMEVWKKHFAEFQPPENHFYPPMTGIKPGDILFIDTRLPAMPHTPGLIPLASGVLVLYSDAESFMVMTPQGFPEAGWNTFSVYEDNGIKVAQVQSLARATDPVYELGLRFMGGASKQENTWTYVLSQLAAYFAIENPIVEVNKTCLDRRVQWRQSKNVWQNAALRSTVSWPWQHVRRLRNH